MANRAITNYHAVKATYSGVQQFYKKTMLWQPDSKVCANGATEIKT